MRKKKIVFLGVGGGGGASMDDLSTHSLAWWGLFAFFDL